MAPGLTLRIAAFADSAAITDLIARSVHGLGAADYTAVQREAAVGRVFLVDPGLIADGSYYVVADADGRLVGAGGWSDRRALHGGHVLGDTGERIDPGREPARIRAYFVDPAHARRGIASAILRACEEAARRAGFGRAALGATLTGLPFYARHGYRETGREEAPLGEGRTLTVVLMEKALAG